MSLIDQANDRKHVWKTLDVLCELINRFETSRADHSSVRGKNDSKGNRGIVS